MTTLRSVLMLLGSLKTTIKRNRQMLTTEELSKIEYKLMDAQGIAVGADK